jgi:predicted RNA-binding Zn-ribbon protein involved in translation (DUF1610 family)
MGLRCLLGHDFGEAEVEREREEDGDEMVVTIREVKTCSRCGTERVVSENKEVTAIRSADDVGMDDRAADAEPTTDQGSPESVDPTETAEAEDTAATPDDDQTTATADTQAAEAAENAEAGADTQAESFDPPESAAEDDGVILSEEGAEDREPGEWPDADRERGESAEADPDRDDAPDPAARAAATETVDAAQAEAAGNGTPAAEHGSDAHGAPAEGEDEDVEFIDAEEGAPAAGDDAGEETTDDSAEDNTDGESTTAWPDHGGEDEGFDARAGGDADDVSFGGNGLTPDVEADAPDGNAEYVEADAGGADTDEAPTDPDPESGIAREGSASVELSASASATGEFHCPNCGLTRPADGSSMRAGDICPECRKGYITERDA